MQLTYTVFSADEVKVSREVDIDGVPQAVLIDGLSVQLTAPGQPTITLALSQAQAKDHPFVEGEVITVTFGGSE